MSKLGKEPKVPAPATAEMAPTHAGGIPNTVSRSRLSKEARNGSFDPQQIPAYARRTDDPKTAILTLYRKVNTTREIADLVEKFYGRHYSAATVSDIAEAVQAQAETFRSRPPSKRYGVGAACMRVRLFSQNDGYNPKKAAFCNNWYIYFEKNPIY